MSNAVFRNAELAMDSLRGLLVPLGFAVIRDEKSKYWGTIAVTYRRGLVRVTAGYDRHELDFSVVVDDQEADLGLLAACLDHVPADPAESAFAEDVQVFLSRLGEIEAALEWDPVGLSECLRSTGAERFAAIRAAHLAKENGGKPSG